MTNKYRNIKTTIDGITFASTKEAHFYGDLKLLVRRGDITDLKIQPKYPLILGDKPIKIRSDGYPNGRKIVYIADFSYVNYEEQLIVVDVKGFDTPVSRLKRAIVEAIYGIEITVI